MNFIKTKDPETKALLLKNGFQLLSESNGIATFLNDAKKKVSFDQKKVAYTNVLAATTS